MHKFCIVIFLAVGAASGLPGVSSAKPFPQLLPPANEFELTLREDPNSKLPLGPSCGGEAGLTLACRAFVVTLKNVGGHTVHLSRIGCQEPVVSLEIKEPNSSSGWMGISQVTRPPCTPWSYVNLRLKPGESADYMTRLTSPNRAPDFAVVEPRSYTIRARWMIWGCTENPEGSDCLAPLQVMKTPSSGMPPTGGVEIQTPIEVVSGEIAANSPALPDLGSLKLIFEISIAPEPQASEQRKRSSVRCGADPGTSLECTVFHYAIHNLGDRPVRNGRFTCSDYSIMPEYRVDSGGWTELQPRLQACAANVYFETPILPGKADEGNFIIANLAPDFDTAPLYPAGKYRTRFRFQSSACFASPDGSFCLARPKEEPVIVSNEVAVHATEFVPPAKPIEK